MPGMLFVVYTRNRNHTIPGPAGEQAEREFGQFQDTLRYQTALCRIALGPVVQLHVQVEWECAFPRLKDIHAEAKTINR
jgi:hypothetical protein